MAYTLTVGKWMHIQDTALPQVLVLLVQHNTEYITHNNANIAGEYRK